MKNKGFTLTEIIGVIVIVGILGVLAVVTFTGSMRGFREDYYTEAVRTLTESGKEFFNDNRKYRPSDVLSAQMVPISTLVSQKYLDEVVDYKGNKCSNSSYVIIIKKGKDDYDYHACLVCAEDDYNNMHDKYCDSAWQTPTQIEYEIATPPDLYVYRGTPRASLNDELAIKVSYVKKNSKGEVLGVVDGTGFDDVPTIYPENVDIVDTNKVGRYELNYVYNGKTIKGSVTVYEYLNPGETITKENIVATDLHGGTKVETGAYTSGEWTQKIYVTLTPGTVNAGDVDVSTARLRNVVNRYQWNKDGAWQDFCTGDNCSKIPVVVEMNENIKFRSIDLEEKISKETSPTTIRIDNTKPACSLETVGEHKGNDWFTSDVAINFVTNKDLVRTSSEAVSGVKVSNITISNGTFQNRSTNLTSTHNYDTTGVTYIGYVEDNAKNYITCDINFRRDVTDPACTLKTTGTYGENSWYVSSSVNISFASQSDATSGVETYGISSYTGNHEENDASDTTGKTYTGYIRDNAGNTSSCDVSYKKDSTPPNCTNSGGNSNWINTSLTLTGTCADSTSKCKANYTSITKPYKDEINSSTETPGTVYDNAGNSTLCPANQHVHIDHTNPTCSIASSNTSWTNQDITLTATGSDSLSGVLETKFSSNNTTTVGTNGTYTASVKDKAGNTNTCSIGVSNIDKIKPTCSVAKTSTGTTAGVSVSITCQDSQSNCRNDNKTSDSGLTSSQTYTVYDIAGNFETCSVTVTPVSQKSTCTTYTSGTSAAYCGTHDCNCSNCYTGENTCQYGCDETWNSCKTGSTSECVSTYESCSWTANCQTRTDNNCNNGCSGGGQASQQAANAGACSKTDCSCNGSSCSVTECGSSCTTKCNYENTCQGGYDYTNCSNCYYGHNTCAYGCDTCPNTCRDYRFGCDVWSDYSDSACSPDNNKVRCQTVYR